MAAKHGVKLMMPVTMFAEKPSAENWFFWQGTVEKSAFCSYSLLVMNCLFCT
jgi:hypothetical protein